MRRTALTVTIIGLVGSGLIHLSQYFMRYQELPTGWMFIAQAVTAFALVGVVYVGRHGIGAPAAAAAFQLVSLIALTLSFTGMFFGFAERGLRPATALTILLELAGLAGAMALGFRNQQRVDDDASLQELLVG